MIGAHRPDTVTRPERAGRSRYKAVLRAAGRSACGWRHSSADGARSRTWRMCHTWTRRHGLVHRIAHTAQQFAARHIAPFQPRAWRHCTTRRSCRPRRGGGGHSACKARRRGVHKSAACFCLSRSCGTTSDLCRRRAFQRPWLSCNGRVRPCVDSLRRNRTGGGRARVSPYRTSGTALVRGARRSAAGSAAGSARAPSRGPYCASCLRPCASRRGCVWPCAVSLRTAHTGGDREQEAPYRTSDINSGRGARRYDAGSLRGRAHARSRDSYRPLAFSLPGLKSRRRTPGRRRADGRPERTLFSAACVPQKEMLRDHPRFVCRP